MSSDEEDEMLSLVSSGDEAGEQEGSTVEAVRRKKKTVYIQVHKCTLSRLYKQDIQRTDVPVGRFTVLVTKERGDHLKAQGMARMGRSLTPTLMGDVADGLDMYSLQYPTECWGVDLNEITWACTMTKQSKEASSASTRLLVRQSQLTRNPLKAWGIPSCVFYPLIAGAGDDPTLPITDLGIEHDLVEDDADEDEKPLPDGRKRKKNSELVTVNQQRMRRLRSATIAIRILPLHFVPLWFTPQSATMLKINNPMIVCFMLQERLREQLPFYQDDPTFMAALIQFQKNLYFVSHQVVVRASLTDEFSERLVAADGHLHRLEQAVARMEEREKTFGKLLDGYAETLAAEGGSKAPAMRRKRTQVLAQAAREARQASIKPEKIEPDLDRVKELVLSYEHRKNDKNLMLLDAKEEEKEDATAASKKRPVAAMEEGTPPAEETATPPPPPKRPRLDGDGSKKKSKQKGGAPFRAPSTLRLELSDEEAAD